MLPVQITDERSSITRCGGAFVSANESFHSAAGPSQTKTAHFTVRQLIYKQKWLAAQFLLYACAFHTIVHGMKELTVQLADDDFASFHVFCENMGVDEATLVKVFVKKTVYEQCVPFPFALRFYGEKRKELTEAQNEYHAATEEIVAASADEVLDAIKDEGVEVCALVFPFLQNETATMVLYNLPKDRQVEIVRELSGGRKIPEDVKRAWILYIAKKLRHIQDVQAVPISEPYKLSDLLSDMEENELSYLRELMSAVHDSDPELYQKVRGSYFGFDDIPLLDDRSVQRMLREIDCMELARALKGAAPDIMAKFERAMSKRAWAMLTEDIACLGAVTERDVREARSCIVSLVSRLGIAVPRGGERIVE